jgi:hypothetical protein
VHIVQLGRAKADHANDHVAGVLDEPGWYADFRSAADAFVVFPGRIFRYPRAGDVGRAETQAHGRQLDWTV